MNSLQGSLTDLGSAGAPAKKGLGRLVESWKQKPVNERAFITNALWSVSANLHSFANAKEDPMGAVIGAVNIAAALAAAFGPVGMIVSGGISVFAGILSLFGKAPQKQKSVGEIVREQIDEALDKFYDQSLSDEAEGAIEDMTLSKVFLDAITSRGKMIDDTQAIALASHVPVYRGMKFMSKLGAVIRRLARENNPKEAKKCIKFIELYTTIATLKDITLLQMSVLVPESHEDIRTGIRALRQSLLGAQASLFGFLYQGDLANKIMPYFDPDMSPVTDTYLKKVLKLKLPNYGYNGVIGTHCFTPGRGTKSLTFSSSTKRYAEKHPYATLGTVKSCFWKVVPHGNWLYSIVNRRNCPEDYYCGALLSFDGIGDGKARVTIDHEDPVLWEIVGTHQKR